MLAVGRRERLLKRFGTLKVRYLLQGSVLQGAKSVDVLERASGEEKERIAHKRIEVSIAHCLLRRQVRVATKSAVNKSRIASAAGAVNTICVDKELEAFVPVPLLFGKEDEGAAAGSALTSDVNVVLPGEDCKVLLRRIS